MILPIQYLRAFAAMTVVWEHAIESIPGAAQQLGHPFFGSSGVDLFFVISGFIMVAITARGEITPWKFFGLRVIRVVPLYWLVTLAMILLQAFEHSFTYPASAIIKSLLFIPYATSGPIPGAWPGVYPIVGYAWTLNCEMFFYALFALSLWVPPSLRVTLLTLVLTLLFVAGRLFGPFDGPVAATYTRAYILEFAAGSMLALAWLRKPARIGLSPSLLMIALGLLSLRDTNSRFVVTAGAFLLLAGCLHPKICAFHSRPLLVLGDASYSIYLTHKFVVSIGAGAWSQVFPVTTELSSASFIALAVTLSVVIGGLCYRLIERPLTSTLKGFVQPRSAATVTPARAPFA